MDELMEWKHYPSSVIETNPVSLYGFIVSVAEIGLFFKDYFDLAFSHWNWIYK